MLMILLFVGAVVLIFGMIYLSSLPKPSPEVLAEQQRFDKAFGFSPGHNPQMICSHCHAKGNVRTESISPKKGISGGKAAGAILTGGFSLLATGLSRHEKLTQAHCDNCGATWTF
jgi:hypothetical protein